MATVLSIFLKDIIAILNICFTYYHLAAIDDLEKQPKILYSNVMIQFRKE